MSAAKFTLPERYRVTGHVASGGMAGVWAAHDELLGRDVAVKVLAEHLNEDEGAKVRFEREARAAAGLSSHPHVVTIYDVGECEGRSFIVMELLTGGSLAHYLKSGREISLEQSVKWLHDAASALDAAHAQGIVHRDIKPANLLLDDRNRMAIADFGIARIAEMDGVTTTGQVLGTAAYLSPEQALGETATAASDRYALAVVAFQLLTGRRPFEADHFTAQARAHIEQEPPRPSELNPELPPEVDDVLARGLAKTPEDRWESAAAFVDALERAFEAEQTAATARMPVDPRRTATAAAAAAAPAPPPEPVRREPERAAATRPAGPPPGAPPPVRDGAQSNRGWVIAIALAALFALAAVAWATLGDDGGSGSGERTSTSGSSGSKAERTPTATPEETAAPEAEETPAATPEATPTEESSSSGGSDGTPTQLNDRGYAKYQAGDYAGAVPLLQQAVEGCGDSTKLDPCGYALFNLGSALHRAGRSEEGIPLLEKRLASSDYKKGEVEAELAAAKKAAGQGGGSGNGKGKGKKNED